MIYLDAAAIVKLCHSEPGTDELVDWLRDRSERALVSSALAEIEVPRALRRSAPHALPAVPAVLNRLFRVDIDSTVRATAAAYDDHRMRSLDAIHLATASVLARTGDQELTFVTYDRRLLDAAARVGFDCTAPGLG
ncbi:type II toxin-antitoxin system VapC family toxin [Saccharopolyspora sp. CA-218241]|uniref:type II toxin-antitoxin system VapC family toxin n=1 Tax=Saccharopolyspora sp. CA-218241 TaxID=3240027 RepID=UPI003D969C82